VDAITVMDCQLGEYGRLLWERLEAIRKHSNVHLKWNRFLKKVRGVKDRPKMVYGFVNPAGEFGLYVWNQEEQSYALIDVMPAFVEQLFEIMWALGLPRSCNHVIFTFNDNGITPHQDKVTSQATVDMLGGKVGPREWNRHLSSQCRITSQVRDRNDCNARLSEGT
jgi:hypothetical protein